MGNATQTSPDQHVANGTDPRPGIHIPMQKNVPVTVQMIARSECSLMHQSPARGSLTRFRGIVILCCFRVQEDGIKTQR